MAVISKKTTDKEIDELHLSGVRGIRLDLYSEGAMQDLDKQKEMLRYYAHRIEKRGWSMAFLQMSPDNWEPLSEVVATLPVPVVTDHFALMKGSSMLPKGVAVLEQPGLQAIADMMKAGNFWVKLSAPYRCSEQAPHYGDMEELVRFLVKTNPRRVLWGSDWYSVSRLIHEYPDRLIMLQASYSSNENQNAGGRVEGDTVPPSR